MSVREKDNPTLFARVQEQNLLRQAFVEGNGRTARAACYYLICLKSGRLLPGKKIVPERIRENRVPYYQALKTADIAWDEGKLDVSVMAKYLEGLLIGQLTES